MAVPEAFSDLLEISSQVEAAIVVEGDEVVASSLTDEKRSAELAAWIRRLVHTAEESRGGLKQIEVALPEGHVFVVREGGRLIGAVTDADPPSGLVLYDLRTCLSGLAADRAAKKDAAE
jgi:predicted regulator of Ras-like GTPase activity (Roadblock/LC7/MglB family)